MRRGEQMTQETLLTIAVIVAILTGLFVVAAIISVILAILELGWWFGQNYWEPLLLIALFAWIVRSNPNPTPHNKSVTHQSPSTSTHHRQRRSSHSRRTTKAKVPPSIPQAHSQSTQKKKDPRPQSPAVRKNKLAFMQSQKVNQGTGKP